MTKAALVGRKVLAGLAKGRRLAIEQAQAQSRDLAEEVLTHATVDVLKGNPSWGRARRIARKMPGKISERHIRRLLATLYRPSESKAHTGSITLEVRRGV
jgi:hypothetical protein